MFLEDTHRSQMGQVASCIKLFPVTQIGDSVMANNLERSVPVLRTGQSATWEERLERQDYINLKCLEHITNQGKDGSLSKDLSKHVNLTRSPILKRMKQLVDAGLISNEAVPHRNSKMPSTFVYYPAVGLSLEAVQIALRRVKPPVPRHKKSAEKGELSDLSFDPSMDEQCLLVDVQSSISLFASRISKIRVSVRSEHLQLLRFIANHGDLTMIAASEMTGKQRQTVNSQLQRLVKLGILYREKQMLDRGVKEFVYKLLSDITLSDVMSYPFSGADLFASAAEMMLQPTSAFHVPQVFSMSENPQTAANTQGVPFSYQDLAKMMPPFDPDWPDDWKATWFAAFRKIIGDEK
jgi:predicted transcriptional regulator